MKHTHKLWVIRTFLIIALIVPLFNLLTPGYFLGHDTIDHIARIASFYANLQEGTIVPRWAGNLNWGYGHPILMFLYPLPSYLASFFVAVGLSFVNAIKLVFAVSFIASGVAMYIWIRAMWGEYGGIVSAVLYTYAPYRFVDLYVRGALGEHVFFIWPPLVCYFIYKAIRTTNSWYVIGIAISTAFMILSHNALSIIYLPFIGVYMLILLLVFNKNNIRLWILNSVSIIMGFGLSAFFWMPAYLEGKYTLRDVVTNNEIYTRFETITRILYSPWSFGGTGKMSVQLGPLQWAFIAISFILLVVIYKRYKAEKRKTAKQFELFNLSVLLLSIAAFIVSIFMMLELSKGVYETMTIFQKFQFPWRFLSTAILGPAIIGGLAIYYLGNKYKFWLALLVITGSMLLTYTYWRASGYKTLPNNYFETVYEGTTDTGESAPIWSVRFMEQAPESSYEIAEGNAIVTQIDRSIQRHEYNVDVSDDKVRFVENTLYFPGWTVYIDGTEVMQEELMFHDPQYRGLINFYIPQGQHQIVVQFRDTKIRMLANTISIISIIVILSFSIYLYKKKRI